MAKLGAGPLFSQRASEEGESIEPDNDVIVADLGEKFEEEAELQKSLRTNIHQLDEGLIIIDGGTERVVPSGRIDITAEDKNGTTVVIELKRGTADRDAVGQNAAYMGDISTDGTRVRGILIAHGFSQRALAAARVVSNLELHRYGYRFTFEKIAN